MTYLQSMKTIPSFLPSFLPSILPSFLHSFLPSLHFITLIYSNFHLRMYISSISVYPRVLTTENIPFVFTYDDTGNHSLLSQISNGISSTHSKYHINLDLFAQFQADLFSFVVVLPSYRWLLSKLVLSSNKR